MFCGGDGGSVLFVVGARERGTVLIDAECDHWSLTAEKQRQKKEPKLKSGTFILNPAGVMKLRLFLTLAVEWRFEAPS